MALIAPAGPIDAERLDRAVSLCSQLGLESVAGASALARTGYLAGSDDARAADLQSAIDDPQIDAIWALRGGYGAMRLLPRLRFEALRAKPRAYIGFSDNTSVHLALALAGVVSFHAPHAGGDFPPFAEEWFRRILFDPSDTTALTAPSGAPLEVWQNGVAEGRLIGGNLSLLAAAEGTAHAL
ncbi:MAG: LD-carboxypeptidase, partial [Longimicrobiales bacterium]